MRTVVFDIDGLLCVQGESPDYANAAPYPHAVAQVNAAYDLGCRVVVQTARGMWKYDGDVVRITAGLYQFTHDWLVRHGFRFHELWFGKRSADLYVDDRGCRVESAKGLADWGRTFWPALSALGGLKVEKWYEVWGIEDGDEGKVLLMKFPDHGTADDAADELREHGVRDVEVREVDA